MAKMSQYKKAEYKFISFSDSELSHLFWRKRGAQTEITNPAFGGKKWSNDGYNLDVLIQLECQRRKLVAKEYKWYIDQNGEHVN